jgi:hypothetical protein
MKHSILVFLFFTYSVFCHSQNGGHTITSPDKKIVVTCFPEQALYSVKFNGETVLANSSLGLIREDEDFSKKLQVIKVSPAAIVKDNYTILTAKKKTITYAATQRLVEIKTAS